MKKLFLIALLVLGFNFSHGQDQFIGEIRIFAGNYAPLGWAFCNGQTMSIQQNQALFSILGITYGGDGRTTFALPDLRSRVPVHAGYYPPNNLKQVVLGEMGGVEKSVVIPYLPSLQTSGVKFDAQTTGRDGAPFALQSVVVVGAGKNQELDNRQPYLGLNYIIALEGLYPMRN
jgi:microcystin-dependent protein